MLSGDTYVKGIASSDHKSLVREYVILNEEIGLVLKTFCYKSYHDKMKVIQD